MRLTVADWSTIEPIRDRLEIKRNRCQLWNICALSLPKKHSTSTEIVDANPDRNSDLTDLTDRTPE